MKAYYKAIEEKIKLSGYPGVISGESIYDDICEEIEDKEDGNYIFMCKQEDDTYFEYKIDVMENSFNLAYMIIHSGDQEWRIAFDE